MQESDNKVTRYQSMIVLRKIFCALFAQFPIIWSNKNMCNEHEIHICFQSMLIFFHKNYNFLERFLRSFWNEMSGAHLALMKLRTPLTWAPFTHVLLGIKWCIWKFFFNFCVLLTFQNALTNANAQNIIYIELWSEQV